MNDSHILIHYGELGTKGANRRLFVKELAKNVRHALKDFPDVAYTYDHDHGYVALNGVEAAPLIERLSDVSGIQRLSVVREANKEMEVIKEVALALLKEASEESYKEGGAIKTFKVMVKRADKSFPLDSMAVAREVGGYLLRSTSSYRVDVHDPDIVIHVEIRKEKVYLYAHSYPGLGGYPLGMNGKCLMLLSGGIDSPVAAYSLLRRGIKIECVHFAAPPYTSDAVLDKLRDILAKLAPYQADVRLHVIPFTRLQLEIYKNVDEPYCITIMRRMMVRIAERLAKKRHCLAVATGEMVGQVASQTLESMVAINAVTNFPILRPLATDDKLTAINTAKKIGTYEISIRPYEDCCTIFKPKNPKTKPQIAECEFYESKFDFEPLIEEAIQNAKSIYMKDGIEIFPEQK